MAFAITSHNIRVEDSILKADAEPRDGSVTRASTLDLNLFIGNCDGSFDVPGSGFYASAREISYDDRTHVLRALLKKGSGGDIEWVPAALYLNAYVTNDDGDLRFLIPSEQLPDSCVGLHLHNSNLKALCVGSDGTLHPSKIDLDRYFENKDGELEFTGLDPSSTAPPGFYRDSRNIYVRIASNWTAYLYADLRCTAGNYKSVAKDISAYVSNRRGRLMLVVSNDMPSVGPDDHFSGTPFIGFATAGLFYLIDKPWGHAVLKYLPESSVFCAAMLIVGFLIGGMSSGNATIPLLTPFYRSVGEALGLGEDTQIIPASSPPYLRGGFSEGMLAREMHRMLREYLAPGVAEDLGIYLSGVSQADFRAALEAAMIGLGRGRGMAVPVGAIDDTPGYTWMNKLADALVNQRLPSEWNV